MKQTRRIKKLNAFRDAVVHETEDVVYVCREKICSSLGLPCSSNLRLRLNDLTRATLGEHRKIIVAYPLGKALKIESCGQKQLVYFTCAECGQFSTVVYWRLKLRHSVATQTCTKCYRRNSEACANVIEKMLAGRQKSWDVYKQNKPQAKPFTISDSFKAMIQRTYCQQPNTTTTIHH